MPLNLFQKRQFILRTIVLIMGLCAALLLSLSIEGQSKLGIIIGSIWLLNILFNSYVLESLLHSSMPPQVRKQQQARASSNLGDAQLSA